MATKYWQGKAIATAQVQTTEITASGVGSTFTLTIGGIAVTVARAASNELTAAALHASVDAIDHPYYNAITFTVAGAILTLTANVPGVPFVYTCTAAGGGTVSNATTTAGTGANYWNEAVNWSDGAIPATGDTVIIADNSVDICWGLTGNTAELVALQVDASYTGRIGLDYLKFATSANGRIVSSEAPEYRPNALKVRASATGSLSIGNVVSANDRGSDRIIIEYEDATYTPDNVYVYSALARSADTGRNAYRLLLKDGNCYCQSATPGGLSIGEEKPGEAVALDLLQIEAGAADSNIICGQGMTLTALTMRGGNVILRESTSLTTVKVYGGDLQVFGTDIIVALYLYGGRVQLFNTDSATTEVTTFYFYGGHLDLSNRSNALAVTTFNLYKMQSAGRITAKSGILSITTLSWTAGVINFEHRRNQ